MELKTSLLQQWIMHIIVSEEKENFINDMKLSDIFVMFSGCDKP